MHALSTIRGGRHLAMPTPHAPNAALLIDFDNVTVGVRSDLSKELRTLLNSDIIKGKVAVQRAYADWRRYPQYIVSLSESSIDLIFAPAFGTAKKNATDIRLAVDAIELVFTRPEIGTFILLSGDSDFSSMVLKLKEYGKYVIGVGMKESASDILIQNCDEYYSYSDLAGLSRESDEPPVPRDPWVVVVESVQRMLDQRDVMRSDRLKQVMQQLDPAFDERTLGMNRFSKFVSEAADRGLITVVKQENGQYEIGLPEAKSAATGRGRRAPKTEAPTAEVPKGETSKAETAEPREERSGRRRRGGRGRSRGREGGEDGSASSITAPAAGGAVTGPTGLTLAEAFHLLGRALGELPTPVAHEMLRGRMAALHGREDVLLDAERFPRLLRQANDAEVADVRQLDDGHYEVAPHKADLAMRMSARRPVESAVAPTPTVSTAISATSAPASSPTTPIVRPGAVRFRGGTRNSSPSSRQMAPPMVGVIELQPVAPPVAEVTATVTTPPQANRSSPEASPRKSAARAGGKAKAVSSKPTATDTAAPTVAAPKGKKAAAKSATKSTKGAAKATKAAPRAAEPTAPASEAKPSSVKTAKRAKSSKPRSR